MSTARLRLGRGKALTLLAAIALIGYGVQGSGSLPKRSASWLGPFGPVAAQAQWVRAEAAIREGLPGQALHLMESAIELDPKSTTGWISLADHLGLYLASAESGASDEARMAWLQAALDLTRRGQEWAAHPEELAMHRGLLLTSHADLVEPLAWPGHANPRVALLIEAAQAFQEAAELGHKDANQAAEFAEKTMQELPAQ